MRRLLGALVLLVALPLAGTGPLSPAPAAGQDDQPTALEVTLRELDAVLAADDPEAAVSASLQLRAGPQARSDLRLVTTVYTRLEDRAAMRRAAEGDLPSVFSAQSSELPDLAAGTIRVVRSQTPRATLSLQAPDRAGVYPLQFQVFEGPDPVGSVLTSVIVLPEEAPPQLPATTVLRLVDRDTPPMSGDVAPPGLEALIEHDAPLRDVIADLQGLTAAGRAAGITLVPSSRLFGDLMEVADGFQRPDGSAVAATDRVARRAGDTVTTVRALAARGDTQALAVPYGPADLVALVRGGLQDQALELLELGIQQTADVLDTTVHSGILVPPDGLDADTLAALGPAQAEAVLLDAPYLALADEDAMHPVRRLRTADGGEVRVLVPDSELSVGLSDPRGEGTAAVVQRLLAETALQWLASAEAPGRASTAVLLSIDAMQPLPPAVTSAVTQAVAEAPWLRPMGLSALAQEVRPADRGVRLAYPPRSAASELDPVYIARLGRALEALGPLRALLGEEDPAPERLAESLLDAAALGYRDQQDRPAGDRRSAEVLTHLAQLTEAVEIVPSAPITLTAATGEVPVTLVNSGDVAVQVRVQVDSPRFEFADDGSRELTLQPRSAQQLGFDARALNPGGYTAVTVTVRDPVGQMTLTQTRISVRSTAFPIVGLVAAIGSGVVLLVWGLRQSLRRRRPGRHERIRQRETGAA